MICKIVAYVLFCFVENVHKFKFLVYICKIYTLYNDFCINIEEEMVFGVVKIGD